MNSFQRVGKGKEGGEKNASNFSSWCWDGNDNHDRRKVDRVDNSEHEVGVSSPVCGVTDGPVPG